MRNNTITDYVADYKKTAGQEPTPKLSASLINEEYQEWYQSWLLSHPPEMELKELADLVYVIYAYAHTMGWNLDVAINRVHKNNMNRMYQDDGTIHRREDGKIIKNSNTPKVNLKDLV